MVGARFCGHCGSSLSDATPSDTPGSPAAPDQIADPEGPHPRLRFLREEAIAKGDNDKTRLKELRKAEKERQAQLRMRELFAETRYDVQFAQEAQKGR